MRSENKVRAKAEPDTRGFSLDFQLSRILYGDLCIKFKKKSSMSVKICDWF